MEEESKKAYNYLIRLLTRRDYSRYKLEQKLRERKFSNTAIQESIEEIIRLNYLREDNYIEARIKGFMHKNCSKSFIQSKLAEEFLNVELEKIEAVFNEYEITEEDQIERLIQKKLPHQTPKSLSFEERMKIENKIMRYILSKGHQLGLSRSILKTFL